MNTTETPTNNTSTTAETKLTPFVISSPTPTLRFELPTVPAIMATEFSRPPDANIIQAGIKSIFVSFDDPDDFESYLDLDSGAPDIENGDIKFSFAQEDNTIYYLEYTNGATGEFIDEREAGLEGCEKIISSLSSESLVVRDSLGNFFCVLSSKGRISLIYLAYAELDYDISSLTIYFVTWN